MAQKPLNKEHINLIQDACVALEKEHVLHLLDNVHPEDIAYIFYDLSLDEATFLIDCLPNEIAVEVVVALDEDLQTKFFKAYEAPIIANKFIALLDSDDAVDIINILPTQKANEVLSHLEDKKFAGQIISLLHYPEDSAGGLMAKELIKVQENWKVTECIEVIRKQAEEVTKVYTVYVVDELDKVKGTVSLKQLILSKAETSVHQLLQNSEDLVKVNVYEEAEEVANIMYKYDLDAIPVVDALGKLQGRITIDDVVDFTKEEAEKDYQLASGLSENVESGDKIYALTRARLPWLIVGLIGGIFTSVILANYEPTLAELPKLAFFMPLVAAMGGNAGVQSSAIVVQGLANRTMGAETIIPKLRKEFVVALINGLVCSAILLSWNLIIGYESNLGFTVSLALISVIIFASIFGTITPLILNKFDIDPALATGPFITTTNDILGLTVYFLIGSALL